MRIAVMIRKSRTGFSADAPDVPGCIAAAKTVSGTRRLMAKALELHLEMMTESGEKLPKTRKHLSVVPDADAGEEFLTWVEVKVPSVVSRKTKS